MNTIMMMMKMEMVECNGRVNYQQNGNTGQFRATKTWNTIVVAIQEELPIGRRRKGLRIYENSFTGHEAVTWLVDYLEQNKGELLSNSSATGKSCTNVTRAKAALLLQKFIEQKIIEGVHRSAESFRDSSRYVYTFNKENMPPQYPIFKGVTTAFKADNGRVHKHRNGTLKKVSFFLCFIDN